MISYIVDLFVSGSNIYVGTQGGGLGVRTDRGASWKIYSSDTTGYPASDFVFDIFASESSFYAATNGGLGVGECIKGKIKIVPTLGQWGVIIMGLMMMIVVLLGVRRREMFKMNEG